MNQTDEFSKLVRDYYSFFNSRGQRRIVAIKWAKKHLLSIDEILNVEIDCNNLYQRTGWRTYIGVGFYSAIVYIINNDKTLISNNKLSDLSEEIIEIIRSVLLYTDIGYLISLGTNIKKSPEIDYSRIDDMGNIFIYPDDADELIQSYDETVKS